LLQALQLGGFLSDGPDQLLVSFFSACFFVDTTRRATIEELEAHPLFSSYTMEDSMAAVVAEIALVEELKLRKKAAARTFAEAGALPDLALDSSSDESSSDESDSNDEDSDDDDDDDDEEDASAEDGESDEEYVPEEDDAGGGDVIKVTDLDD